MVKNNISSEDKIKIEELRELVKDEITPYYDTDFNLLRWLQGHDYKLDIIVPKLKNHLLFRKSHWDLDNVAAKPRDHPIHEHWPRGYTGAAGKTPNVIINIEQTGINDYWGLLHVYPLNEVLYARVHDLESMLKLVMEQEETTQSQASIMYVMDLTGLKFDMRLTTLITGALASISNFMAEHYVELIHSFVLVGAPSFMSTIWSVAKPLLPKKTSNKVKILNSSTWRQEIMELADVKVLPSYWNTKEQPDVFKADVKLCIPFQEADYVTKSLVPVEKIEHVSVPAGKCKSFVIKGQKLNWKIDADGHFAYGVYATEDLIETNVQNMISVYPKFTKVPGPTWVPLTDEIDVKISGQYHFWFSNEHAWLHVLKLKLLILTK
uniref:CRAL-TRIO domain-containing protein n=1 Tax=Rhabditophanes sp. KR3021 TaxID=114890 RepID=A0AC35TK95_9BILA